MLEPLYINTGKTCERKHFRALKQGKFGKCVSCIYNEVHCSCGLDPKCNTAKTKLEKAITPFYKPRVYTFAFVNF